MNESIPLNWIWFNGAKGTVGIVRAQTHTGEVEYRIGAVDGFMEKMDVLQVIAWGAKFPQKAGDVLMGNFEENSDGQQPGISDRVHLQARKKVRKSKGGKDLP